MYLLRKLHSFILGMMGLGLSLQVASAAEPALVKNLNITPVTTSALDPNGANFVATGRRLFYWAEDPAHGRELWTSDGTATGTRMVKDIRSGRASIGGSELVTSGNLAFFAADDGEHGQELWVSDGTPAGTRMVTDLVSLSSGRTQGITGIRACGKGVIFFAPSDWNPLGLWWSDGTETGTRFLRALPETHLPPQILASAAAGNTLYLQFGHQLECLWKTDGTVAGTQALAEASSIHASSERLRLLGATSNALYLIPPGQDGLWKIDAKNPQPVRVKDLGIKNANTPVNMVANGAKAYFQAHTEEEGWQLWVTDGTETGTRRFRTGAAHDGTEAYQDLKILGSLLITSDNQHLQAHLLTTGASRTLIEVESGYISSLTIAGSKLFFTADIGGEGRYLYSSNGTPAGTKQVTSRIQVVGDAEWALTAAGAQVFFLGGPDDETGRRLWKSNGTDAGTQLLQGPVAPYDQGSDPSRFVTTADGWLYFSAFTGVHGRELWRTNGTSTGTALVKETIPGPDGYVDNLVEHNGQVFFTASVEHRQQLWRSDGTHDGTVMVEDLSHATNGSGLGFRFFQGRLYFVAYHASGEVRCSLWSTDGTPGNLRVEAVLPEGLSVPYDLQYQVFSETGERLYFTAGNASSFSLFYIDGTPAATLGTRVPLNDLQRTKFFVSGPAPGLPGGTALYFAGLHRTLGWTVYRLNPNGTTSQMAPFFFEIRSLDLTGDSLAFVGDTEVGNGYNSVGQIWRITGAEGGSTALVSSSTHIRPLGVLGGDLYYYETNGANTGVIRRLDVDSAEVTMLAPAAQVADRGIVLGDALYFTDQSENLRLFQTRGTPESTFQIADQVTDFQFALMGNRLFFPTDDAQHGAELHSLDIGVRLQISQITGQHGETETPISANGGVVDLGPQYVSYQSGGTLMLRNTGLETLMNVVVPVGAGPFTLEGLTVPRLEPGEHVQVYIAFTPQSLGLAETSVTIIGTGTRSGAFSQTLALRGTGITEKGRPFITRMPDHRIVRVGEPLMWQPDFHSGQDITGQLWQRGSTPVATTSILHIPSSQLQDAGLYTFTASNASGSTKSSPTTLVVVGPMPETVAGPEGGVLTLKVNVAAPKGSPVTYQWLRGGVPLTDVDRVRGSRTATLQVNGMREADTGLYECAVMLTLNGQTQGVNPAPGTTLVTMLLKPVLTPDSEYRSVVSEDVSRQISVAGTGITLTAKGLPAGLKMNAGGLVTGRPTRGGNFTATYTATNAAGSVSETELWKVHPALPAGVYDGLISMDSGRATETQLGSRLMMAVASSGVLSGRLIYEGKALGFAGMPVFPNQEPNVFWPPNGSEITVPQGGKLPALTLKFESSSGGVLATLRNGSTHLGSGFIYQTRFYATGTPAPEALIGHYTWRVQAGLAASPAVYEEGHASASVTATGTIPEGCGYATASITPDGLVFFQGRLADGTALVGSSPILLDETYRDRIFFVFRHYLYPVGGAVTGTYGGEVTLSPEADDLYRLDATLDWKKAALPATSKERNHKEGIPLHEVTLTGATYALPDTGKLVWNLIAGTGNARFTVSPTGWETAPEGSFSIGSGNKVTLPAVTAGQPVKTLTFDVKKGTFKGTLLFLGDTPKLNRTVNFEGCLDSSDLSGAGFFLLPELPAEGQPASALNTTPIHSGRIEIQRASEP